MSALQVSILGMSKYESLECLHAASETGEGQPRGKLLSLRNFIFSDKKWSRSPKLKELNPQFIFTKYVTCHSNGGLRGRVWVLGLFLFGHRTDRPHELLQRIEADALPVATEQWADYSDLPTISNLQIVTFIFSYSNSVCQYTNNSSIDYAQKNAIALLGQLAA